MTPNDVRRRYSNGLDFDVVFKNGYKKRGMCAVLQSTLLYSKVDMALYLPLRNSVLVSL